MNTTHINSIQTNTQAVRFIHPVNFTTSSVLVHTLCLGHLYLKLVEGTHCLDILYNCTVILFSSLCTHFASLSYKGCTDEVYTWAVEHVHYYSTLLVLVLTLMNCIDQSQLRFLGISTFRTRTWTLIIACWPRPFPSGRGCGKKASRLLGCLELL